jgi:hypothetical protein
MPNPTKREIIGQILPLFYTIEYRRDGTEILNFHYSPFFSFLFILILSLSIGSLGKDNSTGIVAKVVLDTAFISETTNGVRIKTWQVILEDMVVTVLILKEVFK